MATIAASVSPLTARRALAQIVVGHDRKTPGYRTYVAASGTTTTAVISALSGIGSDYVLALPWAVNNTDATVPFEYRRATEFSGTTVTFATAFGAAVATDDELDFYPWRPSLYTEALNIASARMWDNGGIYRFLNSHLITHSARGVVGSLYGMPRNMRKVTRVQVWGSKVLRDEFDRANDATTPGNGWTNASGDTLGISSEQLYSAGDANGDYATRTEKIRDGYIEFTVEGTLNSGTTYRTFSLMFRHAEDRNGDLDHNNYLVARLLNGVVALRKVDGGTESSLTTATQTTADGTRYVVGVEFVGPRIRVWVDDVQLIDYELTGLNLKFASNAGRWGFRGDIALSPATAARVDSVYAFTATQPMVWPAWRANPEEETIQIPHSGIAPTGLLLVEGREMLSLLPSATSTALVTDTTATLELSASSPYYRTYLQAAKVAMYELLGFDELIPGAQAALATMPKMPSGRTIRHPMWG